MTHFDCSKVIIDSSCQTATEDGVTYPYLTARVITVNGEVWKKNFYPWGLDQERVRADWDKRQLDTWKKIE